MFNAILLPFRHRLRIRENIRESLIVLPIAGLVGSLLLAVLTVTIDTYVSQSPTPGLDDLAESSKTVIAAVGPAILTFLGVVFSITLVALQMSSGQLSPRVVRLFVRNRIVKLTFTFFIATFCYTLLVQYLSVRESSVQGGQFIPFLSGLVTMLLVITDLILFVSYVHSTIKMMRLVEVINVVTRETLALIKEYQKGSYLASPDRPAASTDVVRYRGRPGALCEIDLRRLIRHARKRDLCLHLLVRPGDYLVEGTTVFGYSGSGQPSGRLLVDSLDVGEESSMQRDISFGFRQIADIGVRALSPAVNDPTTAVQCIDRLQALLRAAARIPEGLRAHSDRTGEVRLIEELPTWGSLMDLAFSEMRQYGADAAQVTRRLAAVYTDFTESKLPDPESVVSKHMKLLTLSMEEKVNDQELRRFALTPDRQGIG